MSWTDKQSIRVIKYLRNKYKIKEFIETDTFKGINARLHSKNFKKVITLEKDPNHYDIAFERLKDYDNVECFITNSPDFLKEYKSWYKADERKDIVFFYLDAHFYGLEAPKEKGKFVVLKELKSLKNLENCVIMIHDFDNNLGHITYDGISLDFNLIKRDIKAVNKNFHYYTNELSSCDIIKPNYDSVIDAEMKVDRDTLDNLNYAWKEPRLTYRGILYATPTELNKKELDKLGLKKWN